MTFKYSITITDKLIAIILSFDEKVLYESFIFYKQIPNVSPINDVWMSDCKKYVAETYKNMKNNLAPIGAKFQLVNYDFVIEVVNTIGLSLIDVTCVSGHYDCFKKGDKWMEPIEFLIDDNIYKKVYI